MDNWLKRKAAPASLPFEKSLKARSSNSSLDSQPKKVAFAAVPSFSDAPCPKATFLPPNSLHLILPVNKSRTKGPSSNSILRSQSELPLKMASVLPLKSSMTLTRDISPGTGVDEIRKVAPLGSATTPSISLPQKSVISNIKPILKEQKVILSASNSSTIILNGNQNCRSDSEISVLSSILSIPPKLGNVVSLGARTNSIIGISMPLIPFNSSRTDNKTKIALPMTDTDKKKNFEEFSVNNLNSVSSSSNICVGSSNLVNQDVDLFNRSKSATIISETVDLSRDESGVLPLSSPLHLPLAVYQPFSVYPHKSVIDFTKYSDVLLDTDEIIDLTVLPAKNSEKFRKLNEIVGLTIDISNRGDNVGKEKIDEDTESCENERTGIVRGRGSVELQANDIGDGIGDGVGIGTVSRSSIPEDMEVAVAARDGIRTFFSYSKLEPSSDSSLNNEILNKTKPTKEEFVLDLVTLRQDTMDAFVLAGLKRTKEMYTSYRLGPLPFIRDPSMFCGPMSVLNFRNLQVSFPLK